MKTLGDVLISTMNPTVPSEDNNEVEAFFVRLISDPWTVSNTIFHIHNPGVIKSFRTPMNMEVKDALEYLFKHFSNCDRDLIIESVNCEMSRNRTGLLEITVYLVTEDKII